MPIPDRACIFVGVRLSGRDGERSEISKNLEVTAMKSMIYQMMKWQKLHVRYMIGGRPSKPLDERLYSFEFPESPGALLRFLETIWDSLEYYVISLSQPWYRLWASAGGV